MSKWTDELLETELRRIITAIGHFPSAQELRADGRNDLACAIGKKTGGYIAWAERLGCARQFSDSDFGWAGEEKVKSMFESRGLSVVRPKQIKSPHDLLVNDVLRVDVKTANYAEYGACKGWFYRIGKLPQADLVFLLQMDTEEFYGLPWFACPTSNVTISRGGGKYVAYLNNWNLILKMIAVRMAEHAMLGQAAISEVA